MAQKTAQEMLLERLKAPRSTQTAQVIQALSGLASPGVQKAVQSAVAPQLETMSPEEKRLAAAAQLEQQQINKQLLASKTAEKRAQKDEQEFMKLVDGTDGHGRGASRIRKQMERKRRINIASQQIEAFLDGRMTPTQQAAFDLSSNISAIIQDGSPTLALTEMTAFNPVAGRFQNLAQQLSGTPREFYTPELINEIKAGLKVIDDVSTAEMNELQTRLVNARKKLLDRNPDLKEEIFANLRSKGINVVERDGRIERVSDAEGLVPKSGSASSLQDSILAEIKKRGL